MMVGTSISNEVDGIRAPTMWPTHLIHHRMVANWSFFERITLRAAVRCKLIAYDADPRHTFWVGRTSYGESRVSPGEPDPTRGQAIQGRGLDHGMAMATERRARVLVGT
jgi:hypothetical protein